jgi:hypothetical protein
MDWGNFGKVEGYNLTLGCKKGDMANLCFVLFFIVRSLFISVLIIVVAEYSLWFVIINPFSYSMVGIFAY